MKNLKEQLNKLLDNPALIRKAAEEGAKDQADLQVRSNREQLIADIVSQCNVIGVEKRKELARRIALAANTLHWSDQDLHVLMKKKQDPTIRNYSAFLNWSIKIGKK